MGQDKQAVVVNQQMHISEANNKMHISEANTITSIILKREPR